MTLARPARSPDSRPVIEMSQVVKTYKTPAGEFFALRGVSAGFWQGEFVSVVGKSGSGKSTLVNMVTGIDRPTSGDVRVGDCIITRMKESQMAAWRGRNLGVVFQFFQLLPMLTLLENVLLPMDFCNMWKPEEREPRALDLLKMVGLEDYADKMPSEVSGGQQQAAAVARALANDPPIILADEPTGNLDSHTADVVFNIFCDLAEQGKTILMVTHDNSLAQRTTRSLLLFDGELIHEAVANALPGLPHRQMLWLTKALQSKTLLPGETLALDGEDCPGLIFIDRQPSDVIFSDRNGKERISLPMQPGEAISLVDQNLFAERKISLQPCAGQPVDLLTIPAAVFHQWTEQYQPANDLLLNLARSRFEIVETLRHHHSHLEGA